MNKRKIKKQICPIGIEDCPYRVSPSGKRLTCPNFKNCDDMTNAWDIPYEYYPEGIPSLVVRASGDRVIRWEKVSYSLDLTHPQCELPCGYHGYPMYDEWEELEFSRRIVETWAEYGWKAAVSID